MLTTPQMRMPIRPFDARIEYRFQFVVEGGAQVLKNRLVITNQSTGVKIYDITQDSFGYRHTIPPNTLINGETYLVKVQTGGLSVDAVTGVQKENWSLFSDEEIVYCLSPARITIPKTIIDTDNQNRVYNQTVDFAATYEQDENEQLQKYRFILYNDKKQEIKIFDEQFYKGTGQMEQQITGLNHRELYYLQIKTESEKGMLIDTELIWFRPFYEVPVLTIALEPVNVKEKGLIKLSANVVQAIGELYNSQGDIIPFEDIEYVDEEKLDLRRADYEKVVFEKGFKIRGDRLDNFYFSDFILKLWCQGIPANKVFLSIQGDKGKIELVRREHFDLNNPLDAPPSTIVAYKTHGKSILYSRFETKKFMYDDLLDYSLRMKQINNAIDIQIQGMEVVTDDIGL